jgi:acyl transferase domain-containing protein
LLSSEGRSFAFDSRANGFGPGEGAGCLVLKPLEDAIKAGDPIRAVIRNSGINQDGRTKGLTLPSGQAQEALSRHVYGSAGLDPTQTDYVETHGVSKLGSSKTG